MSKLGVRDRFDCQGQMLESGTKTCCQGPSIMNLRLLLTLPSANRVPLQTLVLWSGFKVNCQGQMLRSGDKVRCQDLLSKSGVTVHWWWVNALGWLQALLSGQPGSYTDTTCLGQTSKLGVKVRWLGSLIMGYRPSSLHTRAPTYTSVFRPDVKVKCQCQMIKSTVKATI